MTDVRLTATNPEDSSVVPVACNDKGELKLEEPIVFDGNLDGSLTVTGGASFDGTIQSGDYTDDDGGVAINHSGNITIRNDTNNAKCFRIFNGGTSESTNLEAHIDNSGNATFQGNLNKQANGSSRFIVQESFTRLYAGSPESFDDYTISLNNNDGSATFANRKAGFTADGYLWCTTERGDTVYLQGTSNGMGMWSEYTPPSLKDLVDDKLEEWSELVEDKLEELSELVEDKPQSFKKEKDSHPEKPGEGQT